MSRSIVETAVGGIVLAVAIGFLVFALGTTGLTTSGGYRVIAKFNSVDGLQSGADVRMSGIKIGTVVEQTLDPVTYLAVVHLSIDERVALPRDSSARITSEGLLGGMYLAIEPGGDDRVLDPGSEIRFTQGAVNFLDMLGRFIFSVSEMDANGSGGLPNGEPFEGPAGGTLPGGQP